MILLAEHEGIQYFKLNDWIYEYNLEYGRWFSNKINKKITVDYPYELDFTHEQLNDFREKALARMPKRVEIDGDLLIYTDGLKEWAGICIDSDKLYTKLNADKLVTKVKVIIEEVVE